MADNFDFKKFLVENKLGPFSKVKRLNESAIKTALLNQINDEGISDADFIDMLDQAGYEENWVGDIAATIDGLSDNQAKELYTIYSEEDDETAGFGAPSGPIDENTIVVDSSDKFVTTINGKDYKVLYDNHEEGDHIELQRIGNPKDIKSGTVKKVSEDGDLTIVLDAKNDYTEKRKSLNEGLSAEAIDRMESLTPQRDLALAFEYLDAVAQELDDEGFSQADIANYIHMKVAEYYGKPSLRESAVGQVVDVNATLRALQAALNSGADVTIRGHEIFKIPVINLATVKGGGSMALPRTGEALESVRDEILVDGEPLELIYKDAPVPGPTTMPSAGNTSRWTDPESIFYRGGD